MACALGLVALHAAQHSERALARTAAEAADSERATDPERTPPLTLSATLPDLAPPRGACELESRTASGRKFIPLEPSPHDDGRFDVGLLNEFCAALPAVNAPAAALRRRPQPTCIRPILRTGPPTA